MEAKLEEALQTERIHKNLSDLYRERDRFFVEPLMEKIVCELKDHVGFVEQGVDYLDTLVEVYEQSIDALYEYFPLWAMTIVTTNIDLAIVKRAVENYRDRLTYPILIVSNEKIRQQIEEEQRSLPNHIGQEIFPNQWKNNLTESKYKEWKEKLIHIGQEHEQQRKECSKQLQIIRDLEQAAMHFFRHYPYEDYMELKDVLQKTKLEIANEEVKIQDIKKELELQSQKIEHIRYNLDMLAEACFTLASKIQLANTYIQLAKQKDAHELRLDKVSLEEKSLNQAYDKTLIQMNGQIEKIENIRHRIQNFKTRLHVLTQEALYKETMHTEPIFVESTDLKTLEVERRMIQDELNGVHQDRNTLLERIQESEGLYSETEKQFKLREEEAKYSVELIDVYLDNELSELIHKVKAIEKDLEIWQRKIQNENDEKNRYKILRDDQVEKILKKYQYIYTFEEGLTQAKTRLELAWKEWGNNVRRVQRAQEKVAIYLQEENALIQELKIKNARYGFLVFEEKPKPMEIDIEDIDFHGEAYAKKEWISKGIQALENAYDAYMNKKKYIEDERNKYIHYCESHIRDFKLKEAAINGVKKRENYHELLNYQTQMTQIIERNIRIAEEDRRQSDFELQTFLTHLNTYIHQVAVELDSIQKKTRINVGHLSKQIFIFDIPEWNEFEAKEELQKYIESLVEEYDKKSQQENLDGEKLREQIEQQLSVKNLLTIVLKDKSIKIKCRKVTNDMKINKAPMVWESSNKWSGGEKWSKNMTLFLGILNYLAEKKQYLNQSQKSQRTVILDNPFGKASSKHVLDPVFFIAEKLGFQIIALTAHAEGKFVSDYFPVVYSGRLRQATTGDKQLMTSEKFINYAYLHEKSPQSIMRMEEKEQLSFFE